MSILRALSLLAVLAAALPAGAQTGATLRVVRTSPSGEADPTDRISVTFDRPVAGSLDRIVDPAAILRIRPMPAGKLEWRDPVTLRFTPSAPLVAGIQYEVTVAADFRAMDGTSLAAPHRFAFRVRGPTLLSGNPVGPGRPARHLAPDQRFELTYSAPVDLARLSTAAYLELGAACGGQRIVRLTATSQRRLARPASTPSEDDEESPRMRESDTLRRVVQLTPRTALPRGCAGELVAPAELADEATQPATRWKFSTYGDFRVDTLRCAQRADQACPTGPLALTFSTPVRGADVMRHVRLLPETKFTVGDTAGESTAWMLDAKLKPRAGYAVVIDTALRDAFGQPLRGNPARGIRTTGYAPAINHAYGRLLVERVGFRTLAVQHVNVDTIIATVAAVPESLEARALNRFAWGSDSLWSSLLPGTAVQRLAVRSAVDRPMITGVRLPALNAVRAGTPTLLAVRIAGRAGGTNASSDGPAALIQVTDLGVHVKIGTDEGVVWVTGVNDGAAKAGAAVALHDARGRVLATARTDAQGLARLTGWAQHADVEEHASFEGYVTVALGPDRAITPINRYDPDLSPWRFNVSGAWGDDRLPLAGALFTERGIYRPGERVYAKAIVRNGALGALRAPAAGDSIKWSFHDRDDGMLREVTTTLSAFGTADQSVQLPASAAVGRYRLQTEVKRQGKWRSVGEASYRVAEYRPPEFLVDLNAESAAKLPGDRLTARVQARYLFGAPMGRAEVAWSVRRATISSWALEIPGTDGWYFGENGNWWEDVDDESGAEEFASRTDTLDARGELGYSVKLPASPKGRAARVTIEATVTDVNRQTVSARTTAVVHPADFYVGAKPLGPGYFWKVGAPQSVGVIAFRPDGRRVSGVGVRGTIVRREWHRVRRERDGVSELVGEWVSDTVARCALTTAATPVPCTVTPRAGGEYVLSFTAADRGGRVASTSLQRWVEGAGWVPWSDETQFRMDVIPDRTRYSVGDTAAVLFASPFTNAEAWITVEREGLIEQRRMKLASGSATLKFPITEAFAPNAFISIVVARGRSAPPGTLDDAGRPTIRVGYTELRVTPEVKRLAVALEIDRPDYRPADTARVRVRVRDAQGRGPRSEVTLWAVDEGVLSLTGYKTPDPIDLLYRTRGLGLRLASNMTSVAPQIPEGEKGRREAGGGGGADGADVLRSRFQTTAFFLGSVVTDAAGNALATVKLPDNVTTFRLMAVAVTAGDRYGKGQSSMLVTRPLLARQALPRFVRNGDLFTAGAVINRRDGAAATVKVTATATGVTLRGDAEQSATLAALRGTEVRFPFQATRGDSASFRFDVSDDRSADAVRVAIPVRPDHHPVVHALAGVLRDSATLSLPLPDGVDVERSRVSFHAGVSPLATIRGMQQSLRIYPYYCSEQVISTAVPLVALYRAQRERAIAGSLLTGDPRRELARAVEMLSGRQRTDGGIGYWSSSDWTSGWLSAYAGMVMLDARDQGIRVDALVLSRLAAYLTRELRTDATPRFIPVARWEYSRDMSLREKVAAADFMSRFGRPVIAAENELLRSAPQIGLEDRARLAELLVRRGELGAARTLMQSIWSRVRVRDGDAVLADSSRWFYFDSRMRPLARVLTATLAVEPGHPLVAPLVQALAAHGGVSGDSHWNTQDYASSVAALADLDRRRRARGGRSIAVRAGDRAVMRWDASAQGVPRDSSVPLKALLSTDGGRPALRVAVNAGPGDSPLYYYLALTEVPSTPPVTPQDHGIRVERWYERLAGGAPTSGATEGELVRVRLRITVPANRFFVVLDDALPAGLEAVDLSLRTASTRAGPGTAAREASDDEEGEGEESRWYGRWDSGWWTPFDHSEIRDDRVVYSATTLWKGTHNVSYLARATTPGTFIRPPAHAEEMYNPGVNGRSDGGTFVIVPKAR